MKYSFDHEFKNTGYFWAYKDLIVLVMNTNSQSG